jgi:hypothetical protein
VVWINYGFSNLKTHNDFPSERSILPQKALFYGGKLEGLFVPYFGGKLLVRKLAAVALAAGVLVSATGCSFNPQPESLQSYAPSDGSGIDIYPAKYNEHIALRNFFILTDGTTSKLYGSVINSGLKTQTVTLQSVSGASDLIEVKAGVRVLLGTEGGYISTLELPGKAGDLVDFKVTADGGKNWQTISVPVLDGTISYYQELVSGLATPAAEPSLAPTPEPSATN